MKKAISQSPDFFPWFQRNYSVIFITILFTYLLFAFLAPFLMNWGYIRAGNFIYSIYSNLCHQFAHRSWFLFGEQSYYPIDPIDMSNIRSLSDEFGIYAKDLNTSRKIIGNKFAGYKVAICQRDVMIYFSLMLFAFIFYFSHNKIKKIPLWIWFLFAIVPMGFDGFWQLLSTINLFNIPNHESTPLIRSITGALFGFFSGWYLLPAIQDTFDDENNGTFVSRVNEK
jgi:uncharacterized membrane protein